MVLKSNMLGMTLKAVGERVELTAYNKYTGITLVSQPPKDDDKYIYIGQAPNSNYLDLNSSNINELYKSGVDVEALKKVIEKLNEFLKNNNYAQGECSAQRLRKAAAKSPWCCILSILTLGMTLPCYMGNTFTFMSIFNTRRGLAFKAALRFCISTMKELQAKKVSIVIPRSFPAYIQVSRDGDTNYSLMANKAILDETERLELEAAMNSD